MRLSRFTISDLLCLMVFVAIIATFVGYQLRPDDAFAIDIIGGATGEARIERTEHVQLEEVQP